MLCYTQDDASAEGGMYFISSGRLFHLKLNNNKRYNNNNNYYLISPSLSNKLLLCFIFFKFFFYSKQCKRWNFYFIFIKCRRIKKLIELLISLCPLLFTTSFFGFSAFEFQSIYLLFLSNNFFRLTLLCSFNFFYCWIHFEHFFFHSHKILRKWNLRSNQ